MTREQYIESIKRYLSHLPDSSIEHVYWIVDRLFLREPAKEVEEAEI